MIGVMCCGVCTINGTLRADEITMSFESPGIYGREIHYSYDHSGNHANPQLSGNTTAGRFDWTVMSEGPVAFGGRVFNNGDRFSTFTAELTGFITPGETYTYGSIAVSDLPGSADISTMGAFRAGLLQELFNNHSQQAFTGSTLEAAAFQVAIWEIRYEDRLIELGSGGGPPLSELLVADADTFVVSDDSAVVGLANAWLAELTGTVLESSLLGFDSGNESIAQASHIGSASVMIPLPAPLWLAGMGLVAVVMGRKRLRRLAGT
jgi:hypothetical protein